MATRLKYLVAKRTQCLRILLPNGWSFTLCEPKPLNLFRDLVWHLSGLLRLFLLESRVDLTSVDEFRAAAHVSESHLVKSFISL